MFEPITPLKSEINSRSSSDETLTANEENDDEMNGLKTQKSTNFHPSFSSSIHNIKKGINIE